MSTCVGYGECPPIAVNSSQLQAFNMEANAEVHRYCDQATCNGAGQCAFSGEHVACVSNRCRWLGDAGT